MRGKEVTLSSLFLQKEGVPLHIGAGSHIIKEKAGFTVSGSL